MRDLESTRVNGSTYSVLTDLSEQTVSQAAVGNSEAAVQLQELYKIIILDTDGFSKKNLTETLDKKIISCWVEACSTNWDGGTCVPVTYKTVQHAKEIVRSFPLSFEHMPEVFPDAKGGIVLEWSSNDYIVTVAVREGRLVYSGLLPDGQRESGIIKYKGLMPTKILSLIEEIF